MQKQSSGATFLSNTNNIDAMSKGEIHIDELKKLSEFNRLNSRIKELEKIKNQFNLLVSHIDDFVWMLDNKLRFTYVGPSVVNVLGYNEDKFLNGTFLEICHPDSINTIKQAFKSRETGGSANSKKEWDVAFIHKNGQIVWLHTITNPVIDENGKFTGVIGVSRNVTQKKNAEQKTKESRANLKAQLENTADSIWSIDNKFKVLTFNTNFETNFKIAFGIQLAEGINIIDQLPDGLNTEWEKRYNQALKGEYFKVTDHFSYEGTPQYVEVSFNPIRLEDKIIGVSCFSRDITQQVLNEKALKESESRFKTLVSNIPSVAFRCKVDDYWTMEFMSKEIENLCGYKSEDFVNNHAIPFVDIIHENDRKTVGTTVSNAVKNTMSYSVEYRIIHKDGSIKWVHERGRGNYNSFNEIQWLDGVISDISDRKKAENALIDSEQKFRSFFNNTVSAISLQNKEKFFLVNKAWEKITGYSADEAKFIEPMDLVHPQHKDDIKNIVEKRYLGEEVPENYHFHLIDKQGKEKWLDVSATQIIYEGKETTLIIGTEITDRKISELEIRKLSTGIMNSPLSIVITDIEGTIEYANPFFCESTGYDYDDVIGQNPSILKSGNVDPSVYKNLWNTISSGEIWNGTLENKRKDGSTYWESARIAPIMDDNGIIVSFIAVKEDVTEQKRYQEMIEQSEKDLRDINAKKDKFFSIIAHDLRSPLVGLVGLTDLLKDNYKELSDIKMAEYLRYASEASHNLFKLLENLLEWAKSQTGKIEFKPVPIDITELIQDAFGVVNLAAKNKEINLINFVYSEVKISADKNMVFTVLRNLISNAIKYTPRNGRIEVDAKRKDRFMVFSIKDNGIGIPENKQGHLFNIEKNYTTKGTEKEPGSGLGLIICKEFIQKHGGDIWCKSEEGKGSTFSFTLPIMNR